MTEYRATAATISSPKVDGLQNCVVSNWLSSIATDEMRQRGLDIADVLENWNPQISLNVGDFI